MWVFRGFFAKVILDSTLNETFVCLIPKKEKANRIKDFRLISLITRVYKIITKVLANKLKKVILSMIFEVQGTFIGGK